MFSWSDNNTACQELQLALLWPFVLAVHYCAKAAAVLMLTLWCFVSWSGEHHFKVLSWSLSALVLLFTTYHVLVCVCFCTYINRVAICYRHWLPLLLILTIGVWPLPPLTDQAKHENSHLLTRLLLLLLLLLPMTVYKFGNRRAKKEGEKGNEW